MLAGPVEFSTGELAVILLIVLSPSLALGAVCAWLLARRTPKGRRWPRAILGFIAGFIAGLSFQWFGTRLF